MTLELLLRVGRAIRPWIVKISYLANFNSPMLSQIQIGQLSFSNRDNQAKKMCSKKLKFGLGILYKSRNKTHIQFRKSIYSATTSSAFIYCMV